MAHTRTKYALGVRVRRKTGTRVGTIVGGCRIGTHVQWDGPRVPWRPRSIIVNPDTGVAWTPDDNHLHWAGLWGAPLEGRTWACVSRGSTIILEVPNQ